MSSSVPGPPTLQRAAYRAVNEARRTGVLPKYPEYCCACGARRSRQLNVVYHHHDYTKPLMVAAVCSPCHQHIHGGRLPEPWTGQLRAGDQIKGAGGMTPGRCVQRLNAGKGPKRQTTRPDQWAWAQLWLDTHGPTLQGIPVTFKQVGL